MVGVWLEGKEEGKGRQGEGREEGVPVRMYCVRSVGTSCLDTMACSTSVTSVSHSSMSRSALP